MCLLSREGGELYTEIEKAEDAFDASGTAEQIKCSL